MVITYEVYKNNVSVGEVVQRLCGSGRDTYTMWRAVSFLPGGGGGQFATAEAAEKHLLAQAVGHVPPRWVATLPSSWDEPAPGGEDCPF